MSTYKNSVILSNGQEDSYARMLGIIRNYQKGKKKKKDEVYQYMFNATCDYGSQKVPQEIEKLERKL